MSRALASLPDDSQRALRAGAGGTGRTRQALREAALEAVLARHAVLDGRPACVTTRRHLEPYLRGRSSRRDAGRVEAHLPGCRPCAALFLDLADLDDRLRATVLASADSHRPAPGGVPGRRRVTAAVAGLAASALVAGGVVAGASLAAGPDVGSTLADPPLAGLVLPATETAYAEPGEPVTASPSSARAVGDDLVITIPERPAFTDYPVGIPLGPVHPGLDRADDRAARPTDGPQERDGSREDDRGEVEPTRRPSPQPTTTTSPTTSPTSITTSPTPTPTQQPSPEQQPTGQPSDPATSAQPTEPPVEPPVEPSAAPTPTPTSAPTPAPPVREAPTALPASVAPTRPDPARANLVLDVRLADAAPGWAFVVTVENLPAGAAAQLVVAGAASLLPDPAAEVTCSRVGDGPAPDLTCTLTPGGSLTVPVPTTFTGVVEFTVGSADVVGDDPTDNVARYRRS